jgi:hypothetical protein
MREAPSTFIDSKHYLGRRVTDENDPHALNQALDTMRDKYAVIGDRKQQLQQQPVVIDLTNSNHGFEKRPLSEFNSIRDPKARAASSSAHVSVKRPVARTVLSSGPTTSSSSTPALSKLIPPMSTRPSIRPASSLYPSSKNDGLGDKPFVATKKDTPHRPTTADTKIRSTSKSSLAGSSKTSPEVMGPPVDIMRNNYVGSGGCSDVHAIQVDMDNVQLEDKPSNKRKTTDADAWGWNDDDDIIISGPGNLAIKSASSNTKLQAEHRTPKNVTDMNRDIGTIESMYGTLTQSFAVSENLPSGSAFPTSQRLRPPGSSPTASVWVVRYVDYTSKYGLGFLLNTGSAGVYFNDSTKIVMSPDGSTCQYIERKKRAGGAIGIAEHVCSTHSLSSYPPEMHKKVTLLKHFGNYLIDQEKDGKVEGDNILQCGSSNALDAMPYLKKWVRTRHAILFRLSNKTVQVVFFDRR